VLRTIAIVVALAATADASGWTTYRSERFAYELSYPPGLELRVFFDGASGELRDATTGAPLLTLELWPPDLCPRERPGTTAKDLGVERAIAVTQADGDGSSSWCGRPVAVRAWQSARGVALYELTLSCRGEQRENRRLVRERLGKKTPTFFADVSQPWRARVLMLDPTDADPRMATQPKAVDAAVIRRILDTIAVSPLPPPDVVCIEDLPRPGAAAVAR
jgi:hypothetical protein